MYVACSNCGNLNKQSETACYSCGQELANDIPPPPPPSEPVAQDSAWEVNTDIRVQPLNPRQGDATKPRFKDLASRYEARKVPTTQANVGHGLRSAIPAALLTGGLMCAFRKSQVDDLTRLLVRKHPKMDKHGSEIMGYTMCFDLFLGLIIGIALGLTNLLCFPYEASRAGAVIGALVGGVLAFMVGKGYMGAMVGAVEGMVLAFLASFIERRLFRGGK